MNKVKVFRCGDLDLDCDAVIRAGTEEEILKQAVEHANAVDDMPEVPPEIVVKVRAAINEELIKNYRNVLYLLVAFIARVAVPWSRTE